MELANFCLASSECVENLLTVPLRGVKNEGKARSDGQAAGSKLTNQRLPER
jgi:hypothetical protein